MGYLPLFIYNYIYIYMNVCKNLIINITPDIINMYATRFVKDKTIQAKTPFTLLNKYFYTSIVSCNSSVFLNDIN